MVGYYVIISILAVVAAAVTAVLAYQITIMVKRQIKLYYSITLVSLNAPKIQYYILAVPIAFMLFYVIVMMSDGSSPISIAMNQTFGVSAWQTNIMLGLIIPVLIFTLLFVLVLAVSRNAVVDKGVYTNFDRIDWHCIYDYIIDEEKCVLILSTSRGTFSTLHGTTPPFKVAKNDIPKLKFILNKNKNKFSGYFN